MSEKRSHYGRHSVYSPELATEVCYQMVAHLKPITKIAKMDGMPCVTTIFRWIHDLEPDGTGAFAEMYRLAAKERAMILAEEALEIADADPGTTEKGNVDGGGVADKRLRVDVRKWFAAKLDPKTFGEKVDVTSAGERVSLVGALSSLKTYNRAKDVFEDAAEAAQEGAGAAE